MTVMLEAPVATITRPAFTPRRPSFVTAIEAQDAPNIAATYDQVKNLSTDQVAIALAKSDLVTFPKHVLDIMSNESEINDVEVLPPHRPEIARKLIAWVVQGMERLGGEDGLWETDYHVRYMEDQGYPSRKNIRLWGDLDRANMMYMLSWSFHFWAGGEEPEPERVTLWVLADPEYPARGYAKHSRLLPDLLQLAKIRPELKLEAWNGGYRWVSAL